MAQRPHASAPEPEGISDTLQVSRLFDFTLAGKYTVSVKRAVSMGGVFSSTLKATSNKLEITIDGNLIAALRGMPRSRDRPGENDFTGSLYSRLPDEAAGPLPQAGQACDRLRRVR